MFNIDNQQMSFYQRFVYLHKYNKFETESVWSETPSCSNQHTT